MRLSRRKFVQAAAAAAGATQLPASAAPLAPIKPPPDMQLWFRSPASRWADALPIGNGRLGGMVFGGVAQERIGLNDDTLWSGQPRDWNNPTAREHLPIVRKDVLVDKDYQAADKELHSMEGPYTEAYEPLGDLLLDFDHGAGSPSAYKRSLDMDTALARVEYTVDGVRFTREIFSSAPDSLLVVRLTASQPRKLTFTASLKSLLRAQATSLGNEILLQGKAPAVSRPTYLGGPDAEAVRYSDKPGEGMYFAAVLHATADGGTIAAGPNGSLRISQATAVTLTLGTATGWKGFQSAPSTSQEDVTAAARRPVDAAATTPYPALLARHTQDHGKLFSRVTLTLGDATTPSTLPLDARLEAFAASPDPALAAMFFHYGRYLLIASSRPGSQPANLQGIWSADLRPPWSSNYTANINVQMNYWPAETCNLSECALPLIAMVGDLSVNGAKTAQVNYGVGGWVSHHNIDIWRQSAPVGEGTDFASPTWANFCMSGPWLCQHLWEHYAFSGDLDYLRRTAYPTLRGSAQFCLDWLIPDPARENGLTTCPSVSTENIFLAPNGKTASCSAGCTLDVALIHEIFDHCIQAGELLHLDSPAEAAFRARMTAAATRLPRYRIGRFGQLQEWSIDFEEAIPGQRHMSHLYPVYPGDQITPRRTPALAHAAQVSLERRMQFAGGENPFTGWGRAWGIALWARFGNGDRAGASLDELLKHSANINLFDDILDTHPAKAAPSYGFDKNAFVFQIDANFGATAAVAEMLLQSHEGELALLPALPAAWTHGSITGLRARGGSEVDIAWQADGSITAQVRVLAASIIRLRAPAGSVIRTVVRRGQTLLTGPLPTAEVPSERGDTLRITLAKA